MPHSNPYFSGVEDVFVIWVVALIVFGIILIKALSRFRISKVFAFAREDRGGAYMLPYVMTFPFYLLIFCTIVQATLILMVKIGNVNAAYSAARSAIVWRGAHPFDEKEGLDYAKYKSARAAIMAMTPFASGYPVHRRKLYPLFPLRLDPTDPLPREAIQAIIPDRFIYASMYQSLAGQNISNDSAVTSYIIRDKDEKAKNRFIWNKFMYSAASTRVSFDSKLIGWNKDFKVTVRYSMPMQIPGVGRFFGSWWRPYYARSIETTVILPSEVAETSTGGVGIAYNPNFFSRLKALWNSL